MFSIFKTDSFDFKEEFPRKGQRTSLFNDGFIFFGSIIKNVKVENRRINWNNIK